MSQTPRRARKALGSTRTRPALRACASWRPVREGAKNRGDACHRKRPLKIGRRQVCTTRFMVRCSCARGSLTSSLNRASLPGNQDADQTRHGRREQNRNVTPERNDARGTANESILAVSGASNTSPSLPFSCMAMHLFPPRRPDHLLANAGGERASSSIRKKACRRVRSGARRWGEGHGYVRFVVRGSSVTTNERWRCSGTLYSRKACATKSLPTIAGAAVVSSPEPDGERRICFRGALPRFYIQGATRCLRRTLLVRQKSSCKARGRWRTRRLVVLVYGI